LENFYSLAALPGLVFVFESCGKKGLPMPKRNVKCPAIYSRWNRFVLQFLFVSCVGNQIAICYFQKIL